MVDLSSLAAPGFASRAEPDWTSLTPLAPPPPVASAAVR